MTKSLAEQMDDWKKVNLIPKPSRREVRRLQAQKAQERRGQTKSQRPLWK